MLSSYDIEVLIGGLAVLAMYGYAAFWAFNIRKGLTVKLYRNQALGIGVVSVGLAYYTSGLDNFYSTFVNFSAAAFTLLLFATLPLFYWTDQSLLAARQSDPLERDQFHWIAVRRILWIVLGIGLIISATFGIITSIVCSYPALASAFYACPAGGNVTPPPSTEFLLFLDILTTFFGLALLFIPLTSSALLLPLAWRRSNDTTFRRHLKWFALAAILLGFSFLLFLLFTPPNGITSGVILILSGVSGYSLYKSARAVIPLYTFGEKAK